MNWLIIKSESQKKANVPSLPEVILIKNKQTPTIVCTNQLYDIEQREHLIQVIDNATHVLILDEDYGHDPNLSIEQYKCQIFVLGLLVGRHIPIYCINLNEFNLTSKKVRNFTCAEELASFLNNDFALLLKDDNRRFAYKDLLSKGLPITSECFAKYIEKNDLQICQQLMLAGIKVNARDALGTPLLNIAVRNEVPEIVKWLIAEGADVNSVSKDRGYTPVMDAVWKSNELIMNNLISCGADLKILSKEGQSILVLAVGIGKLSICKSLVENGANPDIKDSMGMSAYEYALLFKKADIVAALKPFHKE